MLTLLLWGLSPALATPDRAEYPSLAVQSVREVFPPPAGAARAPADAFGTWLGDRKVLPEDIPVRTFAGEVVHHDARVVLLGLVSGDLQQCADAAIRLRAEWSLESNKTNSSQNEIVFHATSGDPLPWTRYAAGERPTVDGKHIAWRAGGSGDWEGYLKAVFTWAGTASLAAYDTLPSTEAPVAGDLLVAPGYPGHAVVVMDAAQRGEQRLLLIGEGYMPAQDFHIERGPEAGWWIWDPQQGLLAYPWTLPASTHRRWR